MKIWTKIIKGEKILKDNVYTIEKFNLNYIYDWLEEICHILDEPLPIILNKHLSHINEFNSTTFLPADFVENVNFERMVIEIFDENPQKKK
ncbi:MAG: hypothetical protein IKQ31_04885 [Clostridia bacterium]|nr:hypothetical protein [Clostridia bacterium]